SLDGRKALWVSLERLPGLAWLKYTILFSLAGQEQDIESKKYFDLLESELARETDLFTAAQVTARFVNEIRTNPYWSYSPEKAFPYVDRAIDLIRHLPYLNFVDSHAAIAGLLNAKAWVHMDTLQYSQAESSLLAELDELMQSDDRSPL